MSFSYTVATLANNNLSESNSLDNESQAEDRRSSDSENDSEQDKGDYSQCECPCCTMNGPPCQPADVSQSKHMYSHQNRHTSRKKTYNRSLEPSWYKKHPWITVCTTTYKILFCEERGSAHFF